MEATKKVETFLGISLKYYGKEIALPSNQHFSIDQIINGRTDEQGEYNYAIQYGFPQSGCVSMKFRYLKQHNKFFINSISVYAPPNGENMIVANFAPQSEVGGLGIKLNLGLDTGTQEHAKLSEIEDNPNALKMLDIAISDLDRAEVLGECRLAAPVGSALIPCCNSVQSLNNEKTM